MKKVIFTSLSILLVSCGAQQQKPLATQLVQASSGEMILLGKINKANLKVSAHTPWFNQSYETITVDPQWAENLKPHLNGLNIKVFMGTWCDDSQRKSLIFLSYSKPWNLINSMLKCMPCLKKKLLLRILRRA